MAERKATNKRGALFDIDGTLVDTSYLHTVAWWQAFRDAGHEVPMREIHRAIGMGSDKLIPHLIGRDDDDLSTAHAHHYAPYLERLSAFDGAADLLRACSERGLTVVLATSAEQWQLDRLRRAIGADEALDLVTSAGDVEESKPSPDIVRAALEAAGIPAEQAVMVGDTKWDVEAAGRCGVPCVGMLTGGWSEEELRDAGAVEVHAGPRELLERLDASILGKR
jgi:HAD superfamily hydrolase (TIGR01509 family)